MSYFVNRYPRKKNKHSFLLLNFCSRIDGMPDSHGKQISCWKYVHTQEFPILFYGHCSNGNHHIGVTNIYQSQNTRGHDFFLCEFLMQEKIKRRKEILTTILPQGHDLFWHICDGVMTFWVKSKSESNAHTFAKLLLNFDHHIIPEF